MKIHIRYNFKEGAWGGANQFLKALRNEFIKKGVYSDSFDTADAVLFDSYQNVSQILWCWLFSPRKKRIYRLGPVFHLHRPNKKWKLIDYVVVLVANMCATLVIFQSEWSLKQARALGFSKKKTVHYY